MTKTEKLIHVAAAVIERENCIFIAKRPAHVHQGGLWEFPGGKVEDNEDVQQALVRELEEEIGITPTEQSPLIQIKHHYPDKSVLLDVWKVSAFKGEAHGKEGQEVQWVDKQHLREFNFPEANKPIIQAAQLPDAYLITPEPIAGKLSEFLTAFEHSLKNNIKLAQLRAKTLNIDDFTKLVSAAQAIAIRANVDLYINCNLETAKRLHLNKVHLSSKALASISARPEYIQIATSCHNAEELLKSHQMGADFAVLSSIKATQSHPNATPMGWNAFQELTLASKLPIFALGGLKKCDIPTAKQHGAQGIAGISTFWQA